jgi:hypothetical protein
MAFDRAISSFQANAIPLLQLHRSMDFDTPTAKAASPTPYGVRMGFLNTLANAGHFCFVQASSLGCAITPPKAGLLDPWAPKLLSSGLDCSGDVQGADPVAVGMIPAAVFSRERDDLSGKLVIDVPHDSGFLVIDIPDCGELFLFTQVATKLFIFPPQAFVLSAVAKELGLPAGGDYADSRAKDAQIHA